MIYVCERRCYWKEQLWKPGMRVNMPGKEIPPRHFVPEKDHKAAPQQRRGDLVDAYKVKPPPPDTPRPMVD